MSEDSDWLVPTDDLLAALNSPDTLTVAIRGHLLVERVLDALLGERLPAPHVVELRRLSFALKLDLLAALAVVSEDCRRLGQVLNAVRNRFAHRADASFGEREAHELRAAFGERHRQAIADLEKDQQCPLEPTEVLRHALMYVQTELEAVFSDLILDNIRQQVLHEMVNERLKRWAPQTPSRSAEELERRVAERLRQRMSNREDR